MFTEFRKQEFLIKKSKEKIQKKTTTTKKQTCNG